MNSALTCTVDMVNWTLNEPLAIARSTSTHQPAIIVTLVDEAGHRGRGEATGCGPGNDQGGETTASIASQVRGIAGHLYDTLEPAGLRAVLPPGGALNALDCALWDLRAKQLGMPVAQLLGLPPLQAVLTAYTIAIGNDDDTRRRIRAALDYPLIKVKVNAERHLSMLRIVRDEHPACRLLVDANGSWTRALLLELLPSLQALGVELIEQPVAPRQDYMLAGLSSPVPLAADESCNTAADLPRLAGLYQAVNIKLDKCGGLTQALQMLDVAASLSLVAMVGNMYGSSLAMAPAFLVAQRCRYVDLDGPLLQREDIAPRIRYDKGTMLPPEPALWG